VSSPPFPPPGAEVAGPISHEHRTILAGAQGAEGVRRLALDPGPAVRDLVAGLVPGWDGGALPLLRTKYKPSRKLTATYVLPGDPERHVAVIWTNDDVQAFASPVDPLLPHAAALHDPAHLAGLVGPVDRVETLRYRPGQRHVLRVTGDRGTSYVKVDKHDSGARSVPLAETLGPRVADRVPGAFLAEPIGWAAGDRAGLWRGAPGTSLRDLLEDPAVAAPLLRLVGTAVRVLHDTPVEDLPVDGRVRGVDAEVRSTTSAAEHVVALLPDAGADARAIVADATARLDHLPAEPATVGHGDLKVDNVLAHEGSVRLLDLDRCGPADPALDLAKLTADLHWWSAEADALVAAFREGYGPSDPLRWERAAAFTPLLHLKLTARRCAVHDPAWESDVRARLRAAAPVPAGGAR